MSAKVFVELEGRVVPKRLERLAECEVARVDQHLTKATQAAEGGLTLIGARTLEVQLVRRASCCMRRKLECCRVAAQDHMLVRLHRQKVLLEGEHVTSGAMADVCAPST